MHVCMNADAHCQVRSACYCEMCYVHCQCRLQDEKSETCKLPTCLDHAVHELVMCHSPSKFQTIHYDGVLADHAPAAREAWILASTREKQNLDLCRTFFGYGSAGRRTVEFEWRSAAVFRRR